MNIAGIDFSSHAIDIVTVHIDDQHHPVWYRYTLDGDDAFDRSRHVARVLPGPASAFWDDIVAVGIEEPAGKFKPGAGYRIQGSVLACIPPRTLVKPWPPSAWRKAVDLPGNSTKLDVARWSDDIRGPGSPDWPQDAHDAHCIALATRTAITVENAA